MSHVRKAEREVNRYGGTCGIMGGMNFQKAVVRGTWES